MKTFVYDGPVMKFETVVTSKWTASTTAVSAKKALSNLAYRFKREMKLVPQCKISLDAKKLREV